MSQLRPGQVEILDNLRQEHKACLNQAHYCRSVNQMKMASYWSRQAASWKRMINKAERKS